MFVASFFATMTIIIGEREVTTVEFVQHEINKLGKLLESGQIELNCYNIRREKAIDEAVKPDPSKDVTTVYVGHVHKGLTKEVVQDGFAQFGHVAKIEMLPRFCATVRLRRSFRVPSPWQTLETFLLSHPHSASKKPRKEWWAVFVEYVTHQAAGRAIFEMNNKIPDDWPEQHKPLLVKWAGLCRLPHLRRLLPSSGLVFGGHPRGVWWWFSDGVRGSRPASKRKGSAAATSTK